MIQTGSPRRSGGLGWRGRRVVGRGRRGRLGFGEDLGDVEEMTLARVVEEAFAALAEEVAAQQGQGLGQLVVLLLQLVVIGRGLVEHAFEFVDPALGVFGPLRRAVSACCRNSSLRRSRSSSNRWLDPDRQGSLV